MDKHGLSRHRKLKWLAIGLPCLLLLYVLSIGPIAKLDDSGLIGERANNILCVLYAPLKPLGAIPGMRQIFNWYLFRVWKCDTMGDNTL
jgi:hypothetical protein